MPYKDKQKQLAAQRKHYARHTAQVCRLKAIQRRKYRDEANAIIRAAKSVPCVDCRQSYPYYVMDFDHVHGCKIDNISSFKNATFPKMIKALKEELTKCEPVCANCHRIRTYKRMMEREIKKKEESEAAQLDLPMRL
jgi:hypothetical protein